jgi:hypothetical protein
MLLAIDVGNTQTVVGLYDLEPDNEHNVGRRLADTHLLDHWRVATNSERTDAPIAEFVAERWFARDIPWAGIVEWVVSLGWLHVFTLIAVLVLLRRVLIRLGEPDTRPDVTR